jgi:hypothetical protein
VRIEELVSHDHGEARRQAMFLLAKTLRARSGRRTRISLSLHDHSPHCRRDPAWKARIPEIEGRLDADGRAQARTLAADLTLTLVDKI